MKRLLTRALGRAGFEIHRLETRRTADLLRRRQVDLVLDVGAARGWYGIQLRRGGYRGAIISFEPLSTSFEALQRASARDDQWTAVNRAMGDAPQTSLLNVARNGDSSSILPMLDRHRLAAPEAGYVRQEEVAVSRLDDELSEYGAQHNRLFLKMDVQGLEKKVLEGAPKTIERLIGVQIELSFAPLYEGGMLYDQALIMLRDAGFIPVGFQAGFRDQHGDLLQADIVMVRPI
jgi:FkbM family methyltransferase